MTKENHIFDNFHLEKKALLSSLEIGKLLTSTLDLSKILELIMARVSQLIPAQNWSLLLKDESTETLKFEVAVGIDSKIVRDLRIPLGNGVAGQVVKTGQPAFVSNGENDKRIYRTVDQLTGFTTRSLIALPLKTHDKILGVIEVVNVPDLDYFKQHQLPTLQILTDYAAIAIENSTYFSRIQKMSITDEYTGLFNARYLHSILEDLVVDCSQNNKPLSVVFMDVDNFKRVVDTYGHLSGSKVLKEIGQTISALLSETDILIKYGGDEYIILLPGKDKETAVKQIEEIRVAIRKSTYLKSENKSLLVTASFGIATYPADADCKKDLLLAADNSMYKIKKTTKNGIGVA